MGEVDAVELRKVVRWTVEPELWGTFNSVSHARYTALVDGTTPELQFEWDAEKARSNFVEYGIHFREAIAIFDNELIQHIDDREDYGEVRIVALGRHGPTILRVVYTLRGYNIIRIISAQKASKYDRQLYHREIYGK